MRIIPVLDLMGGVVVRGIAGRRSEYRPMQSRLCDSAEPAVVARSLAEYFDFGEFYIADLDAICGREPAWKAYEQIAATGARLLVDAGVRDCGRALALSRFSTDEGELAGVIAGLESVASPALLAELVGAIGADRLIFSLDLKHGWPLTDAPEWRDKLPAEIAGAAIAVGIRRLIVLDLADVGTGRGTSTLELCRALMAAHPACELIAGGGVRGPDDLRSLAAAGCDAALVASALHDGRITKEALNI